MFKHSDVPENYVENDLDCDDTTDTRSPANTKSVMVDNTIVDEQTGENLTVYYLDDDEDGYGDLNNNFPHVSTRGLCSMQMIVMMMTMIFPMLMKYVEMLQTKLYSLIDDETSVDAVVYYEDGDGDDLETTIPFLMCSMENGFVTTIQTLTTITTQYIQPEVGNDKSDDRMEILTKILA